MLRRTSTATSSRRPSSRTTGARLVAAGSAATLVLGLAGCGGGADPEVTASPRPTTTATGVASSGDDSVRPASGNDSWKPSTPDVTVKARTASVRIGTLAATVRTWNSACAATSRIEESLAGAQRALRHGRLSGARALLAVAASSVQMEARHNLVSPTRSTWFTAQARTLIGSIPTQGTVSETTSFPLTPRAQRCTGATPDSRPTSARPMFMLATSSDGPLGFLGTPSTEDTIHTAVTVGIGAIPTVVGLLAPETEVPDAAIALLAGLTDLFWPQSEPDNVTWTDMTTYVGNEIDQAVTKIDQVLDAQQIATMNDDLTALHTAMDRYTQDMDNLTKSPTSFAGISDADRTRAYDDWLVLDQAFTSVLPHFSDDPTSYKNLPETINLYTLYLTTLRGWVLSPDVFNNNAAQSAAWKAQRLTQLSKAIAQGQAIVDKQLPQLEAAQPTGLGTPLDRGWNRHWKFMDAMYAAGFNQVYYWEAMNPSTFVPDPKTGRINVPLDTTVVATPCFGAYTTTAAGMVRTGQPHTTNGDVFLPDNADPTDLLTPQLESIQGAAGRPLMEWRLYADLQQLDAIQLKYQGRPFEPIEGWQVPTNANVPKPGYNNGESADLQLGSDSAGWITRAEGKYIAEKVGIPAGTDHGNEMVAYGGGIHVRLTTTTIDAKGASTSTTGPYVPSAGGVASDLDTFDVSLPGYVLAWSAMPQTLSENLGWRDYQQGGQFVYGYQDSCIAFGFRSSDSY